MAIPKRAGRDKPSAKKIDPHVSHKINTRQSSPKPKPAKGAISFNGGNPGAPISRNVNRSSLGQKGSPTGKRPRGF